MVWSRNIRMGGLPGAATAKRRNEERTMPVKVRFQPTPNPNAVKFTVDRAVVQGKASKSFYGAAQAAADPVASALFALDGVSSVFMVDDFVTVTKTADADWSQLVPAVTAAIEQSMT
jgi:hypothetical protein